MQVAGQFVASFLLDLRHPLLLLLELPIQAGVLQRHDGLLGDRLYQLDPLFIQFFHPRMPEQHEPIHFQADDERNADRNAAAPQRQQPPQFRVARRVIRDLKLAARHGLLDDSDPAGDHGVLIGVQEAPRRNQLKCVAVVHQERADQLPGRGIQIRQGTGSQIERQIHHSLVVEGRIQSRGSAQHRPELLDFLLKPEAALVDRRWI